VEFLSIPILFCNLWTEQLLMLPKIKSPDRFWCVCEVIDVFEAVAQSVSIHSLESWMRRYPVDLTAYVHKSDFHLINVYGAVKMAIWLAQIVSYLVLHRSKIPLVPTTRVTHLRILVFRQYGDNSEVRRVYLAFTAKLPLTE